MIQQLQDSVFAGFSPSRFPSPCTNLPVFLSPACAWVSCVSDVRIEVQRSLAVSLWLNEPLSFCPEDFVEHRF